MSVPMLPPPTDLSAHPRALVGELEHRVGTVEAAQWCAALLVGGDPREFAGMLPYVGGRAADGVLSGAWELYWARTWGARGLRYVWVDAVSDAVVLGVRDEHWRPAEMSMKVAALHELGEAGPAAVGWLDHPLPRVRATVCHLLGVVGDTEHVAVVDELATDDDPAVRRAAARAADRMRARLDLGPSRF